MVRCHHRLTHSLAQRLSSVFAQKVASASGTYAGRPTIFRTARCLRNQTLTSAISPSANLITEKNRSSCGSTIVQTRCPQTHEFFLAVITADASTCMTIRLSVVEYSSQPNATNHRRCLSAVARRFERCRACARPSTEVYSI